MQQLGGSYKLNAGAWIMKSSCSWWKTETKTESVTEQIETINQLQHSRWLKGVQEQSEALNRNKWVSYPLEEEDQVQFSQIL